MLVMELCIAIAAAILRTNLENYATNTINVLMSNYENDINAETQLNQVQKQYGCCGANSVVDYHATNITTPSSCCSTPPCADKDIFPKVPFFFTRLLDKNFDW
ncbi:hypothetical protein ACTXT7_003445 [Hymenolepis weldensis]